MTNGIEIYDTTLRDGTQGESVSFAVADKCRVAEALDALGVHFIEGGWPGSNPRDVAFFAEAHRLKLNSAQIVAFGSTRRKNLKCEADPNIQALILAETPAVTVFGKSWVLHVTQALNMNLTENLEVIEDSVRYLAARVPFVIYDAEHFFDGYRADPAYALSTLNAAAAGGAKRLVLCDTNGGSLPHTVERITKMVVEATNIPIGIHCHNDGELAVANTLAAVRAGAVHVQGTINGYGERCGNANLCSLIPNLQLKLGFDVIGDSIQKLRAAAQFVSELANLSLNSNAAFVGDSAFAHKGGVHVSAVERNPATYEHVEPQVVGNRRRVLVSDLSGRANLLVKARELGMEIEEVRGALEELKKLENAGFEFEAAEASFELLVKKLSNGWRNYFELVGFRVIDEHSGALTPLSEATIDLKIGGHVERSGASGTGPVHALDQALRKALEKFYPSVADMRLVDYKVRVINSALLGTASLVRVLITSSDGNKAWGTVGVSPNIVEASWHGLVDSVEYKLMKDGITPLTFETASESVSSEHYF